MGETTQVEEGELAIIYLLHFTKPYRHARHYLGITKRTNLDTRIEHHRKGWSGSALIWHAKAHGCDFVLARTWTGTRFDERRRKGRGLKPLCPVCRGEQPRLDHLAPPYLTPPE